MLNSSFIHQTRFCAERTLRASRPLWSRSKSLVVRASQESWDLRQYVECRVDAVRHTEKFGHMIVLKLLDTSSNVLPVYIGDFECAALMKEINKRPSARPMTHDLMKSSIEALGFKVSRVRITALVGSTYHARIHYSRADGKAEVDVDARPSDAINLAVRFSCPIYVNKDIAVRMGQAAAHYEHPEETHGEILRSCKEEILHFHDPTIMHKLNLQLAIAEERFEEAARIRDEIEKILSSDRELGLVVAMETAIDDQRFEEAARIRDELKRLRKVQERIREQLQSSHQQTVGFGERGTAEPQA